MDTLKAGATAGLLATAPMSATMLLLNRVFPETRHRPLPPEQITAEAADAAGVGDDLGRPGVRAATAVGHVAYGAAAGALYAATMPGATRTATGVAAGLALWAAGYLGWAPALGLMPPATRQPPERNAVMIAAHAVWGAATALVLAELTPRR